MAKVRSDVQQLAISLKEFMRHTLLSPVKLDMPPPVEEAGGADEKSNVEAKKEPLTKSEAT